MVYFMAALASKTLCRIQYCRKPAPISRGAHRGAHITVPKLSRTIQLSASPNAARPWAMALGPMGITRLDYVMKVLAVYGTHLPGGMPERYGRVHVSTSAGVFRST